MDNTVIVFGTDHGDMLGSHRIFNKGLQMYEETHHIPLIMNWPGLTEPNSECAKFVSSIDLMATFLEIAGAKIPKNIDSRSLLPLLRNNTGNDWPDDIYAEFHGYESTLCSIRMVRNKSWKYIYNPCSIDELYDLDSDPFELHNLANQIAFKHVLRRMKDRLVDWMSQTNDSIVDHGAWQSNSYDLFISNREQ
jgi:arylsulfatase A-like enzyme